MYIYMLITSAAYIQVHFRLDIKEVNHLNPNQTAHSELYDLDPYIDN